PAFLAPLAFPPGRSAHDRQDPPQRILAIDPPFQDRRPHRLESSVTGRCCRHPFMISRRTTLSCAAGEARLTIATPARLSVTHWSSPAGPRPPSERARRHCSPTSTRC